MTNLLKNLLNQSILQLSYYSQQIEAVILKYSPRLANFNRFEKFLVLNIIIMIFYSLIWIVCQIQPKQVYRKCVKIIFKLPFVKGTIQKQLIKIKTQIGKQIPQIYKSTLTQIPNQVTKINIGNFSQQQSLKGLHSGSRYPERNHSDFVCNYAKEFGYSNPLHFDLHPYLKQMEVQVINMTASMLNFKDPQGQPAGALNSGGTESIFMAILAYRQYGCKERRVKNPNLVISQTGHVAAHKACDYLQIQIRVVKEDKNHEMDISAMKRQIDSNTICVYTSYPNYPYGTIDPIDKIAQICHKIDVPVHVDMCLGGFLVPFLKNEDQTPMFIIPKGVTSISVDPHKYGQSGKGVSVLLYSQEKYLKQQFFITTSWPGGLYGTPGIAGSRSGTPIASAWLSMMKIGVDGYSKSAKLVQNATLKLAKQLQKMHFYIYGKPKICIVAFKHNVYSIDSIQSEMKKKGWKISLNQKPLCLHFSFTPLNSLKVDQMISDFKQAIQYVKKQPLLKESPQIELYGACAKIPDGNTKGLIVNTIMDCYVDS